MSWHTNQTKTTTYNIFYYQSHLVIPIELVLNYELINLYLLKTSFIQKPKHPV
jgi:hypothetical protein